MQPVSWRTTPWLDDVKCKRLATDTQNVIQLLIHNYPFQNYYHMTWTQIDGLILPFVLLVLGVCACVDSRAVAFCGLCTALAFFAAFDGDLFCYLLEEKGD